MKLLKKTFKPSFTDKPLASYLYSFAGQKWLVEQDPMTDLWNVYQVKEGVKEYLNSDESFSQAKNFIKLNGEFISKHETLALHV